ncbi:M15 family metallopeptidase [Nocardioides sp. SR21]|uniref:M15 family metallopeptidase n=1 Tax=Nocardioides sp. SR21 TaxID=2919501 RepID=UPI001FA99F5B|nr:M15 family metallopeptidase [Nocardioides sp. SR21]
MLTNLRLPAALLAVALVALGCGSDDSLGPGAQPLFRPAVHLPQGSATTSRVDPELRLAFIGAKEDARTDGVTLVVNSGWRSRAHQQRLFDEAVQRYGSEDEARRYVATPDGSAHVTGDALDIGPPEGAAWLGEHGAAYGLCQVFANEAWHFELATSPGGTCPEMLPDSSYRG